MSELSVELQVTSIRSRGKFGGVIFAGNTSEGRHYVVVCNFAIVPDPRLVDKGQLWVVRGTPSARSLAANGYRHQETQIEAREAELIRPNGRNIISWIADCPDCPGIGRVKATKLYERFGTDLITHVEQKNVAALTEVISEETALLLCHAFAKYKVANTLLWLDRMGIPRRIGTSVVSFYQEQAEAKLEANPYLLISFEANWTNVDTLARQRFNIPDDDPRRLESAIEEALYRGLKQGHTCLPEHEVKSRLVSLLGSSTLAQNALSLGWESTQYRKVDGLYQPAGTYVIEKFLADRLRAMVVGEDTRGQQGLFSQFEGDLTTAESEIAAYERIHGIELSVEQRQAVLTSAGAYVSLILGGAGTGKTTVLKALYHILSCLRPDVPIYQLALAGRAAQRMAEATGRESMTIAGFLTKIDPGRIEPGTVIVVDEFSMVDIILMYRLLRHLPPGIRMVLVGDPSQLPPIGPGLVLHALTGHLAIPQVELKIVKRQSVLSGIPQIAASIRNHSSPVWTEYLGRPDTGVSFIPCCSAELELTVQRVYGELGGTGTDFNVQILSITNSGLGGVKNLNASLHSRFSQGAEQINYIDPEFGLVGATTLDRIPLRVGDLVIYTENDYELGLRNGSLGTITKAIHGSDEDWCCICDFEGVEFALASKQLQALNHAYSITVHKSQGSQFKRVIVPISTSRLLDQALIYTAVTRGVEQVVLIGDVRAALAAIKAPASAAKRNTSLSRLLKAETRQGSWNEWEEPAKREGIRSRL